MKKKTLIITIIALACMIMVCAIVVVACGGPKVTGVRSLAATNVKAHSDVESYHMNGKVNMKVSLDSGKLKNLLGPVDPKLPVKMTIVTDGGPESAHITTDAEIKVFGESVPVQTAEVYLDVKNRMAYTRTGKSRKWKKAVDEDQIGTRELAGGLAMVGKTVLENGTYKETEKFYTLTIPAEKAAELVANLHLLDRVDLGIADVRDITVEGGLVIYRVDKETNLLHSIELKDVAVRGTGTYEGMTVKLKSPVNGVFRFSQYNEVEESKYTIPEDVLEGRK